MARDVDPKMTRLFDRRTLERNIKKGLITRKDYEKHLKTLDDVADKGVYGGTEPEPAEAPSRPSRPRPTTKVTRPPWSASVADRGRVIESDPGRA